MKPSQTQSSLRFLFLGAVFLGVLGCASARVTRNFAMDLAADAEKPIKWELVTVQPDFIGKTDFLAVVEVNGKRLESPLIFGIDVVLLPPGEHEFKLMLGRFESLNQLAALDAGFSDWQAELGSILLRPPAPASPADSKKIKRGRNYLVASYDELYTSNTKVPGYLQRWIVRYPRTIEAGKNWSIEALPDAAQPGS